jgi:hypothetical protein
MNEHSFMSEVLSGSVDDPEVLIMEEVDNWHTSDSPLELHGWLGMTPQEYKLWLEKPDSLWQIIIDRMSEEQ